VFNVSNKDNVFTSQLKFSLKLQLLYLSAKHLHTIGPDRITCHSRSVAGAGNVDTAANIEVVTAFFVQMIFC